MNIFFNITMSVFLIFSFQILGMRTIDDSPLETADTYRRTCQLTDAIHQHDLKLAKKLLKSDIKLINIRNWADLTPLECAIEYKYTEGVRFLLENGAKTNIKILRGDSRDDSIKNMVLKDFNFEYLKLFIQYSPSIAALGIKDKERLEVIVNDRMHDLIEHYLQSAPDINALNKHGSSLLHNAVQVRSEELVQLILRYNPNVDLSDKKDRTPLAIALKNGFLDIAEMLINYGAHINDPQRAFLHNAVSSNNQELVAFLLAHKANPNLYDNYGRFPLLIAAKMGSMPIIELLLKSGADINAHLYNGTTALMIACENNQLKLAEFLLDRGAKIDIEGKGKNPLFYAIEKNCIEFVTLCSRYGDDVKAFNKKGFTPLHAACEVGSETIVQFLLQKSALIDAQSADGLTPLMVALFNNKPTVAAILLKAGARLDRTLHGSSILQLCVQKGCNDAVKLLLQQQIIRNQLDPQDTNLLKLAVENNNSSLVESLIPFCKITQEQGQKFLRTAILHKNHEIVRILLKNGIREEAKQLRPCCTNVGVNVFRELLLSGLCLEDLLPENVTYEILNYISTVINPTRAFISAAQKNDQQMCIEILQYNSIEINLPDELGNTALHYCVQQNNSKMVQELLMLGADPTIKNKEGRAPLSYATSPAIVNIFVTAAMSMKEVNMRAIFQESKKLAACVNTSISSYQAACNRIPRIKYITNLISYIGYTISAGLLYLNAHKGYPFIKSHNLKTFLKQNRQALAVNIFTLATTVMYKNIIANYFMHRPLENLAAHNKVSNSQALVLQKEIKDAYQKKFATRIFSEHLQVSDDRIRYDFINGFNPQDAQSLTSKLDRFRLELLQ